LVPRIHALAALAKHVGTLAAAMAHRYVLVSVARMPAVALHFLSHLVHHLTDLSLPLRLHGMDEVLGSRLRAWPERARGLSWRKGDRHSERGAHQNRFTHHLSISPGSRVQAHVHAAAAVLVQPRTEAPAPCACGKLATRR